MDNNIEDRLEQLCHPMAEALSDYDRLNAFVHVGMVAVEEITLLRSYLSKYAKDNEKLKEELAYHKKQRNL